MSLDAYTVFVRDANGDRSAVIDQFAGLTASVRANDIGVLAVDIPARLTDPATGQLAANPLMMAFNAGNVGVEIVRNSDGRQLFGGPMFEPARARDGEKNLLSLTVHDDIEWLKRRLAFPWAPAGLASGGADDIRKIYDMQRGAPALTVAASTAILNLVDDNLGSSTEAGRQVAGFAFAADQVAGDVIEFIDRYVGWSTGLVGGVPATSGTVLTVAQQLAAKFGLVFAMIDGEFTVREEVDRSATVVFSFADVSLISYTKRQGSPEANFAWVATNVDGSNVIRGLYQVQDSADVAAWGRVEGFYDDSGRASGEVAAVVLADGARFLVDKVSSEAADISTREGPIYGIDYELGDLVTVRLDEGDYVGEVTEIHISNDQDGWRVQPIIGKRILNEIDRKQLRIVDLQNRVTALGG